MLISCHVKLSTKLSWCYSLAMPSFQASCRQTPLLAWYHTVIYHLPCIKSFKNAILTGAVQTMQTTSTLPHLQVIRRRPEDQVLSHWHHSCIWAYSSIPRFGKIWSDSHLISNPHSDHHIWIHSPQNWSLSVNFPEEAKCQLFAVQSEITNDKKLPQARLQERCLWWTNDQAVASNDHRELQKWPNDCRKKANCKCLHKMGKQTQNVCEN